MSLSITPDQTDWTPEQKKMLGAVVHGGRLDEGTSLQLLHLCQSLGVDLFRKECYAIARGGKVQIQMGVDGLAKVAHRNAAQRNLIIGNKPVVYYDADGKEFPFAPKAGLYALRYTLTTTSVGSGAVAEFTSTVLMHEYKQPGKMWSDSGMPAVMLEKVALSKALRMAFPELAGVYSTEEVDLRDAQNDKGFQGGGARKPEAHVGQMDTADDGNDPFSQPDPVGLSHGAMKQMLVAHFEGRGTDRPAAIDLAKQVWVAGEINTDTVSDEQRDALMAAAEATDIDTKEVAS